MVGAKAFGHFALFKVARRKAGTLSGRYLNNGYTHQTERSLRSSAAATNTAPLQSCVDTYAQRQRGQIVVVLKTEYGQSES